MRAMFRSIWFSSAHGTVTMRHLILHHATRLNAFKWIQIMQGMVSDHNGLKVDIVKSKICENLNIRKQRTHCTSEQSVQQSEDQGDVKDYLELSVN